MSHKRPTANPLSRTLFFWVLAISSISITSTVIFLSLGYRISVVDDIMTLIYTGSVKYKSEPRDVEVFIDDRTPGARRLNFINGSYHVTGIRPGLHTIRMEAPGYKTWEKTVRVRSGITTNFWNATLVREQYDLTKKNTIIDAEHLFFSADNAFVAYPQVAADDDNAMYVPIVNVEEDRVIKTLTLKDRIFGATQHENIEWSPAQNALIIPVTRKAGEHTEKDYLIASTDSNITHTITLREVMPIVDTGKEIITTEEDAFPLDGLEEISHVRWHPGERDTILFLSDGNLYRVTFAHEQDMVQEQAILLAQNVVAYDFADDGLYLLDESGRLTRDRTQSLDAEVEVLTTFPETKDSVRIIAYDRERIVQIDDRSGHLTIYNALENEPPVTRLLDVGVRDVHFSDDGKKLLYHTEHEAHVYFVREWTAQPVRDADSVNTVLTVEDDLDEVLWTFDYEHFIAVVGKDLYLVELDDRGGFLQTVFLERHREGSPIVMDKGENILYIVDRRDNEPFSSLYSLTFPYEKSGLLPL